MKRSKLILLLIFAALQLGAQSSLPRSTPEAEGVSSQSIINFLDAAAKTNHEFHSLMIVRHGKVITEGWWNPYRADLPHTLYSLSKSFTATAIGFAVTEGKLSVEDKVIGIFPDEAPSYPGDYLAELKVKHLLTMSVGMEPDPTGPVVVHEDWVRAFFNTPTLHEPGSVFLYNSAATFMLSAIVQKVTGQKVIDYLTPRLFQPLGISGIDWEVSGHGINTGGWGLRLKTEDIAKFGQLFLQKGMWNGKQLIPAAWIEEASSVKIMQDPDAPAERKDASDWLQGYCYQMWRSRHDSFRGDGANGQYCLVLPDLDAVIAITSETGNMQGELNLVWDQLLPGFQDGKLPADKKLQAQLKSRMSGLSLQVPGSSPNVDKEAALGGKIYTVVSGSRKLKSFGLSFGNGICHLTLNTDSLTHQYDFGSGKWVRGETTKFGPYLVWRAQANRKGLPPFKTAAAYEWVNDSTLELTLRYIESPHTETIRCVTDQKYVSLDFINFLNQKGERTVYKGIVAGARPDGPKLIVRGDDMGFSHAANKALIASYQNGIETSIEVIVPSPWFPEAVRLLKENPRVDVGLHFAITSEWDNIKWRPLSDCPSLKNPDGYFYTMLYPNNNYKGQSVMEHEWKIGDVEKEMRAQIEMAKKYIPQLSHVSGHMGSLGFDPAVKALATKLAREYDLAVVDSDPASLSLNGARADLRNKSTAQRIDAFVEMLDKLEDGKTYLFVEHPGFDSDELQAIYHMGNEDVAEARQDVTTMFISGAVREAVARKGIELVSYVEAVSGTGK